MKRTFYLLGATGNLAALKLYGALSELRKTEAGEDLRLVGAAIEELTAEEYRRMIETRSGVSFPEAEYVRLDFTKDSFDRLVPFAEGADELWFYLAVSPAFFAPILNSLFACAGLERDKLRVMIEKPYGTDHSDAAAVSRLLRDKLDESRIFRVDHYLGKPGVQELLACREKNSAVWDGQHISEIDVLMAETVGIEERADFYRRTGAVIDAVQNHLLQLLILAASEGDAADRAERLNTAEEILHSFDTGENTFFCAQYLDFETETMVGGSLWLDTPRWEGTRFSLLTGKRMAEKRSEVRVHFRDRMKPVVIDFCRQEGLSEYARLLRDAMTGKRERFLSAEEAEYTWLFGDCIREVFPEGGRPEKYRPGTVTSAEALTWIKQKG